MVSAFDDDLLFFPSYSWNSLPCLQVKLEKCVRLSNVQINEVKLEAMEVAMSTPQIAKMQSRFHYK